MIGPCYPIHASALILLIATMGLIEELVHHLGRPGHQLS
jgi:hypothetical protein